MIKRAFLQLFELSREINLVRILQIGVVIALLVGMAGMGLVIPRIPLKFPQIAILALPFLVPPGILLLKKPLLGFFFILPSSILVPFVIGTGSASSISFSVALMVAEVGILFLNMFKKKITLHRIEVILIILSAIVVMAFAFGQLRWYPTSQAPIRAQMGGVGIFILSYLAFYLSSNTIKESSHLTNLMTWFVAGGGFFVTIRAIPGPWAGLSNTLFSQGALGSVFWIWMLSASLSIAIAGKIFHPLIRVAALWVIGVCFYLTFILGSEWVSGWLPPVLAGFVILIFYRPRLILVMVAFALVGAVIKWDSIVAVFMAGDNPYSLSTRLAAWQIMIEVIKVSPLLGLGPANYHYYTPLFNIMGYSVQFNSHNNYIDIIAQTGLIGMAVILWLAVELILLNWRLWLSRPENSAQEIYLLMCMGGIVATFASGMLGDWFLPFVYNVGMDGLRSSLIFWVFAGGLVAIERMRTRQQT